MYTYVILQAYADPSDPQYYTCTLTRYAGPSKAIANRTIEQVRKEPDTEWVEVEVWQDTDKVCEFSVSPDGEVSQFE